MTNQYEAINRAERAQRIVSDDLFIEAMALLKNQTRDLFFELNPQDSAGREYLHLMERARNQFELILQIIIESGTVSKYELLAEENAKQRIDAIRQSVRNR